MPESELVKGPRIVVIGGGTGSFTLLRGIKHYVRDITALVNMADDGGSTGQLRDELGVLPPGDVRQCLVALSNTPRVRDLFNFRFGEGTLKGHAFGNLFLTALEKMTGSFPEAVEEAGAILHITGQVEPITLDKIRLVLEFANGSTQKGEFAIGHMDFAGQVRPMVRLEPDAAINPAAAEAIRQADIIVIAPGNIYATLAPALVVRGVSEALRTTSATLVYVCNLVTKPGQTDNFSVEDYAAEIERFMDGPTLDYVLYNNHPPSEQLLQRYAHEGEYPVAYDTASLASRHYNAKGLALVAGELGDAPSSADAIAHTRSLIRHDSDRVARELMKIYFA